MLAINYRAMSLLRFKSSKVCLFLAPNPAAFCLIVRRSIVGRQSCCTHERRARSKGIELMSFHFERMDP